MPGCCRLGWLQRLDDCIVVLQMCMPFDERSPSGDMGMLASNIFILRYIKYKSTDNNYNIDRQQSINIYIYDQKHQEGATCWRSPCNRRDLILAAHDGSSVQGPF